VVERVVSVKLISHGMTDLGREPRTSTCRTCGGSGSALRSSPSATAAEDQATKCRERPPRPRQQEFFRKWGWGSKEPSRAAAPPVSGAIEQYTPTAASPSRFGSSPSAAYAANALPSEPGNRIDAGVCRCAIGDVVVCRLFSASGDADAHRRTGRST